MLQDRRSAAARAEEAEPEAERARRPLPLKRRAVLRSRLSRPSPVRDRPLAGANPSASPPAEEKIVDAELAPSPPRRRLRNVVLTVGALALLAAGAWYGYYWWVAGRFIVSTDDAYVGAKNATLAAKVSGYVQSVAVEDNAHVRAGDVIARIDDGDYQLAVQTAQATRSRPSRRPSTASASRSPRKQPPSTRPRRSSPRRKPAQTRAELELEAAAGARRARITPAARRSSRRKPTAIRPWPRCRRGKPALEAAEANVDVLKAQQDEAAQHAQAIPDGARQAPSAICPSP